MSPYPIDTHCHLHFSQYDGDRDSLIEEMFSKGMPWVVNVCTEMEDIPLVEGLYHKDNRLLPTIGVHPHYVSNMSDEDWAQIERLLSKDHPFAAIGEVGIDLFRNLSPIGEQIKAFERFLQMAVEQGLPVIVHSRDSNEETLSAIDNFKGRIKFVVHCFSGDRKFAAEILDRGGFLSFTGNITYKKSDNIRDAFKYVPIDRIMLETDAPYLSPQRIRGQRNTPLNVLDVAQKGAEIKAMDLTELIEKANQNALEFFKKGRMI